MNIEFANKLVDLRKKMGMSQEAVAEKLGLSRQAISRWERAEGAPDMNNLIQLSKLYKVSLDQLVGTDISVDAGQADELQERQERSENNLKKNKSDMLITQIPFPFIVPVFVIIGLFGFHEGYNWLGKHKPNTMQRFPFPITIITIYLLIGLIGNCWDPCWIILLTIPVYYVIAALIKRK